MTDRKQQIKISGVGLPRTGTASLQRALQILGFKCHHMQSHILEDPFPFPNGRTWIRIYDTKDDSQRQQMIKDYYEKRHPEIDATVDFPGSLLPVDLLALYPDAKVILSVRKSPEVWRKSFNMTLDLTRTPWFYYSTLLLPSQFMLLQPIARQWDALNARRFNGAQIYLTNSTEVYNAHNKYIRDVVPQSQLLEHESSQGWQPLCKFLGVPVPKDDQGNEIPYPHVNDGVTLRKWFFIGAWIGGGVWCLWILGAYLALKAYHRWM